MATFQAVDVNQTTITNSQVSMLTQEASDNERQLNLNKANHEANQARLNLVKTILNGFHILGSSFVIPGQVELLVSQREHIERTLAELETQHTELLRQKEDLHKRICKAISEGQVSALDGEILIPVTCEFEQRLGHIFVERIYYKSSRVRGMSTWYLPHSVKYMGPPNSALIVAHSDRFETFETERGVFIKINAENMGNLMFYPYPEEEEDWCVSLEQAFKDSPKQAQRFMTILRDEAAKC